MKRLVVFGDSFIEGYTKDGIIEENFVKLLGDRLGVETINLGFRGNGNVAISYDVLNYVRTCDLKDTAFLVIWSEWDRNYLINAPFKGQFERFRYVVGTNPNDTREPLELVDPGIKRWQTELAYNGVCNILRDLEIPFLMMSSQCNQAFYDVRIKRARTDTGSTLVPVKKKFLFVNNERMYKEYWIGYPSTNNTLYDIILENWLADEDKHYIIKHFNAKDEYKKHLNLITLDSHPNEEGHKLIAKTLEPYIRRIL